MTWPAPRRLPWLLVISAAVIAADRLTKIWVGHHVEIGSSIPLIPGVFGILTGDDVAVLNVIRMGDEPKRLSEIGQLLNRVDVPNLQYATRKLVKAGLIETEGSSSRKETRYRATATGRSVTEAYAALRATTLPPMLEALDGWAEKSEATGSHLELVSSLYTQAAQVAITRRHQP